MESKDLLTTLIDKIGSKIKKCLIKTGNGHSYVDPNENKEISNHYSMSHAASGFILLGLNNNDEENLQIGYSILNRIVSTYKESVMLPAYHYDFNNFAFCLMLSVIKHNEDIYSKLEQIILSSKDSKHNTINWLPMRMLVNRMRYGINANSKFNVNAGIALKKIKAATYDDGHIDDLLPKGKSFNLQYNISTVAALLLYKDIFGDLDYDIEKAIAILLSDISIDGDINYMGRGSNQLFAWGPWLYITSRLSNDCYLKKALNYLEKHIDDVLDNDSMMMTNRCGKEKYQWWDYHYASVYTAHLFLWLILALNNLEKPKLAISKSKTNREHDSGFVTFRNDKYFVAKFNGRKNYLAEKGPSIVAIGLKDSGMMVKSSFGPRKYPFGIAHSHAIPTYLNHFGLIEIKENYDFKRNRYLKRLDFNNKDRLSIQPMFGSLDVILDNCIEIVIEGKDKLCLFNLPMLKECKSQKENIDIVCDGNEMELFETGSIFTQYGETRLFQTKEIKGKEWRIRIKDIN